MPHVRQLQRRGLTFSRYFVTDSLCCPSRSSIFTGRFPHDTGDLHQHGRRRRLPGVPQQGLGEPHVRDRARAARLPHGLRRQVPQRLPAQNRGHVPPGWTDWRTAGNAYGEFNYNLNENGALVHYGNAPGAYLTDVLATKGSAFINQAAAANKPFVLELATFAPHAPYTPAPRDANKFPGLRAPRAAVLQPRQRQPAAVAARPREADRAAGRRHRRGVPQARPVGSGGRRPDRQDRGDAARPRPRPEHLHRVQLRQRLPHGRAPPEPRQDDRVRLRHPGAADRRRARRAGRPHRPAGSRRTSTCTPRSSSSPGAPRPGGRRAQPRPAPARPARCRAGAPPR